MPKKTYTVKEVASLLGFSTNTVYKYLEEGRIKSTRLGKEGRFRVPDVEMARLLQESRGATVSPLVPVAPVQNAEIPLVHVESRPHGAPSLFDWFIGFLSMALGFSQFIFPSYLNFSSAGFVPYIQILQGLMFVGGALLISFDILKLEKAGWHNVSHVVLGIIYFLLTVLFIVIGVTPIAIGYLAPAIIILVTATKKLTEYSRFLVYINLLYLFLGVGVLIWPKTFFLGSIINPTLITLMIFSALWLIGAVIIFSLSILSIKRQGWYIKLLAFLISLSSVIYATFAFTNGFWERSIYCVILAAFAVIFPFSDHFQSFTLKSKKEVVGSFAWLIGVFFIGIIVLYIIYQSFQSYILRELNNRVSTASDVTTTFMDGNMQKVATFAGSDNFVPVLESKTITNSQEEDKRLKEMYLSSAGTLRRVLLTNSDGVIVDTYPYNLSSQGTDISNRDYFQSAKNGNGASMTGIVQPSSQGVPPAVVISAPIKDLNGKFLGVLLGSVDLAELGRRISQVKFGQDGLFLLVDSSANYIVAPTQDKILTKAPDGSFAAMAVAGKSGVAQGYDDNGNMSFMAYKRIDPYGWGMVAVQPLAKAFEVYSITGFVTFLVYIMSAVGSLVFIIYFKKGKNL